MFWTKDYKNKDLFWNIKNIPGTGNASFGLCIHLIEGEEFTFSSGQAMEVIHDMSCDVKNVIHVICSEGNKFEYIG